MVEAWRYYWFQAQVDATTMVNGLIYFIRRLPILGKKIPTKLYRMGAVKSLIAIIMSCLMFMMKPLIAVLLLAMDFLVANAYNDFIHPLPTTFTFRAMVAVTIYTLGGLLFRGLVFRYIPVDLKAIKLADYFVLDRLTLARGLTRIQQVIGIVLGPFLSFFGLTMITQNYWILFVGLGVSFFSWFWRGFIPRLTWSNHRLGMIAQILYWCGLVGVPIALVLTGKLTPFVTGLFSPIGLIICWIGVFGLWWYQHRFSNDIPLLMASIQQSVITLNKVAATQKQQFLATGTAMQKKLTLDTTVSVKVNQRLGNNYLNALLFARYRSQLWKKLRTRVLWISGIGVSGLILLKLFAIHSVGDLTPIYGALFFVMYLASLGGPIVQLLFVNCDSAMLFYPFYRQPKAVLSGFFYRFWRIVQYNAVTGALIYGLLLALQLVTPVPDHLNFYLVLLLEVCGMVLFFSFHDLFIYYLLQPFTEDMEVVSPLYRILYWAMYWVAWVFTQVHLSGYTYALAIGVITCIYVVAGTIVIYRVAPKTFRIRY